MEDGMQALEVWRQRYEKAKNAYGSQLVKMDEREALYRGTRVVDKNTAGGTVAAAKQSNHVRNIVFELVESQVDSTIPVPKVAPQSEGGNALAKVIEDSLKADLERLPIELINDMQERTVPIQGGSWFLVEWDNSIRTHDTVGDLCLSAIHPKNVIVQAGVTDLDAADYVFVRMERTREAIRKRYGIDVDEKNAREREANADAAQDENLLAQVLCYFKNADGGIGLFSWAGDTVLEDLPDYQTRRLDRCERCGKEKPVEGGGCECGGTVFLRADRDMEVLIHDVESGADEFGNRLVIPAGTRIPYYKPDRFPVVLRKNVSSYGQLLGDSDVDKIRDQQMLVNKLGSKVEEKLLKGGSYVTLPERAHIRRDDSELKVIDVQSPNEAQMVQAINVQPNISFDVAVLDRSYEAAKSTLGITDSFQGKPDPTASSGRAKQLMIEQASGRLESKRRMKAAAFADLFELMFKFKLAYTDEPRPFRTDGMGSEPRFKTFSRYDFLVRDDAGEWFYDDRFLFSTDPAGALGQNRQAMWEETRKNLKEGTFGDPQNPVTLAMFWQVMETLHYPMAGKIRAKLEQAGQNDALAQPVEPLQVGQGRQESAFVPTDLDAMIAELDADE